MIQLFVNNYECVIPDDFTFTQIEENPEITNKGEFTLDMTLSLLEAKNAIAFGFINRQNKTNIVKTADARMIDDGRVKLGKIIIAKNTDIDVTFQFVAGNSEFNYEIKKDNRKIWELDFGTIEAPIQYEDALFSIGCNGYGYYNIGPRSVYINFVCAPVLLGDEVVNDYTLGTWNGVTFPINGISGKIIMQPYIMYYIKKLPELLGFTLKNNVLKNDYRAKLIYLVNAVDSLNYADALPDMTIAEFIEAIEDFFNISFLVNKMDKSISIESIESNLLNKATLSNLNVLDSYNRDLTEDSKTTKFNFTKVSYDISDSNYFKYQFLSNDVLAKCEIREYANYATIVSNLAGINDLIIYRDLQTLNDYFYASSISGTNILLYNKTGLYASRLLLINKFRSTTDNNSKELVLKIVPASVSVKTITGEYQYNYDPVQLMPFYIQMPKSSNSYYIKNNLNFIETVEGGDKNINRISKLEVALFTGKINAYYLLDLPNFNTIYPFSHVDTFPEFGPDGYQYSFDGFNDWVEVYKLSAIKRLRLVGSNNVISDYHHSSILDTSKEYTFIVEDNPDITANNIFMINGQKYMPISLEREKGNVRKPVTMKCYEML